MAKKRELQFHSWNEATQEIDRLLEQGYKSAGKWNLAQCCRHLNDWLSYPMDGFPKPPFPISLMMSAIKRLRGKAMLKSILDNGFKPGTPTAPQTVHAADTGDDQVAVDTLKKTVQRFQEFSGAIHASPIFGEMDKTTAEQLQLQHFAHHLGFLKPNS